MTKHRKNVIAVVLGAADQEMTLVEQIAARAECSIRRAVDASGAPVTNGTAYTAKGVDEPLPKDVNLVFFVECDGVELRAQVPDGVKVVDIDHHRMGDPGYGLPPKEFLRASSVGQLIMCFSQIPSPVILLDGSHDGSLLHRIGWDFAPEEKQHLALIPSNMVMSPGRWVVHECYPRCSVNGYAFGVVIPRDVVFAAAADHCLEAAYRGGCPGVKPDELLRWRIENSARLQQRDPKELMSEVQWAREQLRKAPREYIGIDPIADLRGQIVPQVYEAAARDGVTFLYTPPVCEGERRKMILWGAEPRTLDAWQSWAKRNGLVDLFGGDPDSGFAGGYFA